jgi:hypothetical protein
MNSRSKLDTVVLLLVLFGISILVRIPNLNQPLGNHHEWLTSTVLRHQQIWYEAGAWKYKFNPIMTYPNQADKNINNQASNHQDPDGNYYYTSYPPFAYIFPYLFFKLLGIYPDILPLQLFNLFFHFLCAWFIYLIIVRLAKPEKSNGINIPALLGFTVYLFTPVTLWFHSVVYMADMMVQTFFIIGIYLFLKISSEPQPGITHYLCFGAINFFMVYTEWLGVFFAVTVFIFTLFRIKDQRKGPLLAITAFTTTFALAFTVWQYAQINGIRAWIAASVEKYQMRSGLNNADMGLSITNPKTWLSIISHYVSGYLPVLALIVVFLAFFYFNRNSVRKLTHPSAAVKTAVYLSGLPVLLHHLTFVNFTGVHDFSVLKTGVLISLIIGCFYQQLASLFPKKSLQVIHLSITLLILGSILQYWFINQPRTTLWKDLGGKIALESAKEEVVFLKSRDFFLQPQLIFYAHRNVATWSDKESAEALIRRNGLEKGVVFTLNDANTDIAELEHFRIPVREGY